MYFTSAAALSKKENGSKHKVITLRRLASLVRRTYFLEALNNLGLTYVAQENFAEAAHCFWNALNQKPDYQDAALKSKTLPG